jgi:fumarate reductase subunit C
MRKLPNNYKQYKTFKTSMNLMDHDDTKMWFIQAYTGFAMFFLGSIHLYTIMVQANKIGPYASSDRVVSGWFWPLYILLLLAVEFHGAIGLYRVCVKWGWFDGKNPKQTRANLKKAKKVVTVIFLTLGVLSLAAYIKIGIMHKGEVGQRYTPISSISIQYNQNNKKVA